MIETKVLIVVVEPSLLDERKEQKEEIKRIVEVLVRHVLHERFSPLQRLKRRFFSLWHTFFSKVSTVSLVGFLLILFQSRR